MLERMTNFKADQLYDVLDDVCKYLVDDVISILKNPNFTRLKRQRFLNIQ